MIESDALRERKSVSVLPAEPELAKWDEDDLSQVKESIAEAEVQYKRQIVWRNVISMFLLHLGALYGYVTMAFNPDIPWYSMILVDFIARFASMGVLAGSHRLWSHRSYKARLPLRILLMIMQTMSLQNDIYDWCRDHRLHHKHSDTNADPYVAIIQKLWTAKNYVIYSTCCFIIIQIQRPTRLLFFAYGLAASPQASKCHSKG